MEKPTLNFRVSTSADAIKEGGTGGSFISTSGIYPIKINYLALSQSDGGAFSYSVNIDYNGNSQTIYGPTIQNKDGKANEIGARSLNKICAIAGLDDGIQPTMEEEVHKAWNNTTKQDEDRTFIVYSELSDLVCQIQLKQEYTKYQGAVKENLVIDSFFREDGASADEITALAAGKDITIGSQLAKIMENESTTKHRLGKDENKVKVTEEEVAAFIKAKADGKAAGTSNAPAETKTVKKNLFGN